MIRTVGRHDAWPNGYRVIIPKPVVAAMTYDQLIELAQTFKDAFYHSVPQLTALEWMDQPTAIVTRQQPDGNYTGYVKNPNGGFEYRHYGQLLKTIGHPLDHESPDYGWAGRVN